MKKKSTVEREFNTKPSKDFLDMIAPSTVKFYTDYFICGNTFRCVWALREYPTSTNEQAILRYLGEKEGVTLHIYTRHVSPAEEKRIIATQADGYGFGLSYASESGIYAEALRQKLYLHRRL